MIAHLRGQLIENDGDTIVVDVGGVGYQVWISSATLGSLPPVGAELRLHVHSHFIKDEPLRLYGFADPDERRLFQTLLDVQGVGPRVALAILAGLPSGELVRALLAMRRPPAVDAADALAIAICHAREAAR